MVLTIADFGPTVALVPFIVDTGAARTTIHALDAIRYFGVSPASLDPGTWANRVPMSGVGGSVWCKESAADYGFRRDDGTIEAFSGSILQASTNIEERLLSYRVVSASCDFRLGFSSGRM